MLLSHRDSSRKICRSRRMHSVAVLASRKASINARLRVVPLWLRKTTNSPDLDFQSLAIWRRVFPAFAPDLGQIEPQKSRPVESLRFVILHASTGIAFQGGERHQVSENRVRVDRNPIVHAIPDDLALPDFPELSNFPEWNQLSEFEWPKHCFEPFGCSLAWLCDDHTA